MPGAAVESMSISSITPNYGTTRGGTRITIRGKGFSSSSLQVSFTSIDGTIVLEGHSPRYVSEKVCEISSPGFPRGLNQEGNKNWLLVTVTCSGNKAKGKRKFKYLEKCSIVRKCLQVEGHNGRCCSDPPIPLYGAVKAAPIAGGKIGTALLGYRCKDKHKKNSLPGPRPPPERKPIPGGVIARTPRKCATGPIGGLDDARLRAAKESTAPVIVLPAFGHDIPGGKIGTALLGYRCKDKHKANSMPGPRPPPERKPIPGGVIAQTPRVLAVGTIGGINNARLKTAKESTAEVLLLPGFGHNLPGGTFNLAGSRSPVVRATSTNTPLNPCLGSEVIKDISLPGGRFNLSGSRKKMFRTTYLDEV